MADTEAHLKNEELLNGKDISKTIVNKTLRSFKAELDVFVARNETTPTIDILEEGRNVDTFRCDYGAVGAAPCPEQNFQTFRKSSTNGSN